MVASGDMPPQRCESPTQPIVVAEVRQAAQAVAAAPAEDERHDRHAVAGGGARDALADRDDLAGELVPEDLRVLRAGQRVRLGGRDDRAGDVLVQVGAADAARRDPDRELARARRGRLGDVLDAQVAGGVEAERAHGLCRHGTPTPRAGLPVEAEHLAVGVDDGRGVVVQARGAPLEERRHDHHAVRFRELLKRDG